MVARSSDAVMSVDSGLLIVRAGAFVLRQGVVEK